MKKKIASAPYILWMALFTVIPLVLVIVFAFTNENKEFTVEAFTKMGQFIPSLIKSLKLALISTVICFVLAYPFSYIMSRSAEHVQRRMMMLIMLPMWMSFLLRTYSWMTLLEKNGLINRFFGLFGLGPFQMINTEGAVVVGMVYNFLPFMILPLYTVMLKIDKSVIEAAQDLGSNSFNVIRKVILPLSLPGIISGITMVFVPSVGTFMISRMLGGNENMLIGDLIEKQFFGNMYNPYLGSAVSLLLMVIILITMGIINLFDDEEMEGMMI